MFEMMLHYMSALNHDEFYRDICNPCIVFISIGKNTITVTTADFDSQSKPNHITKIGAVPTMGRAAIKFQSAITHVSTNLKRSATRTPHQKLLNNQRYILLSAPFDESLYKINPKIETLLINFINTKDGAGRITGLTCQPRT